MSNRDFWDGLDPELIREQKIIYYGDIKKERLHIYKMMEHFKDDEGFQNMYNRDLSNIKTDFYDEAPLDMNLIDRINYDEIGDYIDRGLLP